MDGELLLVVILTYFISTVLPMKIDTCVQLDECSCQNSQGIIDLHPLALSDGNPKFKDYQAGCGSYYYSWNPCYPFTEDPTNCRSVTGCQTDMQFYFAIGTPDSAKFVTYTARGLVLQYTATTESITRKLVVALVCDELEEASLVAHGEDPPGSASYKMTLTSKYCCPNATRITTSPAAKTVQPRTCPHDRDDWILIIFLSTILVSIIVLMLWSAIITCLLIKRPFLDSGNLQGSSYSKFK